MGKREEEFIKDSRQVYDTYLKVRDDSSHSIVKSTLLIVELFQTLDRF